MEHLLSNGFEDLLLSKMFPETLVTRRRGKQIIYRGLLLVMWKWSYISSLGFRNGSSPSTVQVLELCNLISGSFEKEMWWEEYSPIDAHLCT